MFLCALFLFYVDWCIKSLHSLPVYPQSFLSNFFSVISPVPIIVHYLDETSGDDTLTEQVGRISDAVDLYFRGVLFRPCDTDCPDWRLYRFSWVLPDKCCCSTLNYAQPLPSKSFSICHSLSSSVLCSWATSSFIIES